MAVRPIRSRLGRGGPADRCPRRRLRHRPPAPARRRPSGGRGHGAVGPPRRRRNAPAPSGELTMPLPLPDLDTRRWSDFLEEARTLLPGAAPGWTDYNASDPGITILELVAWFVEQDMFRANRIPSASRHAFLALAGAPPH